MRELFLLRSGGQVFAVYAEEIEGVAEGLRPAPLPHAPRAVLGIVCVRGRMYTLLDPTALAGLQGVDSAAPSLEDERSVTPRFVVTLRGDEQLALAADHVEGAVEVPARALETSDHTTHALRATLQHGGARVLVLDPARLFDAATQGTERRRRRQ
jgi:chemotaxis signal transduction protein